MPGGLLSAISGILAGGILVSALLRMCFADNFVRSCFVVWCFAVFHEQDHVIRWHISCHPLLEPSCQHLLCWALWVCCVFVFFCLLAFVFVFLFCFVWIDKTSD